MTRAAGVFLCLFVVAGCGGDLSGEPARLDAGPGGGDSAVGSDAGEPEDSGPASGDGGLEASVAFVSPMDGASFVREGVLGESWVVSVTLEVDALGVDHVDLVADGTFALGTVRAPSWSLDYDFRGDGERVLTAIGRDAAGAELARDEITITITPPPDAGCHAMLDALGLDWAPASATRGIADPVRVQPTIRGVSYRYSGSATPTAMLMDCELAPRLVRLAEIVRPYGIDEVIHLGIYNYRCIGGGDPDSGTCTPSMHAYARAIDLHAFGLEGSDETYSTETDFVITMRGDPCPIMSFDEPDRVLKEIACALWEERVFQIILTPNYNDAHRNHYHVDLTDGSMYIGSTAAGIDPPMTHLGH